MKKLVLYGLMLSAGTLVFTACSDDFTPGGKTKGKILPRVSVDTEVSGALPSSRAQAMSIAPVDLSLRLTPADGSASREWGSLSDFNANEEFAVGSYTLEAYYGDESEEGFEKPYYHGSTSLVVNENETTNASMSVALANTMVTISPTDAFNGYFASASFALQSAGSTSEVAYPADAAMPAYMKPGEITIYADVTKPNGKSARLEAARFTAEAKCHYTVTVDVNGGQVGDAQMVITFSDDLDGTETIEIDLSDELFATAAPKLTLTGYDAASSYSFIEGVLPEGLAPELAIQAAGSIASIRMTSESAWLSSQGVAADLDLISMPDATYDKLKSLGMTGGYHRVDKLAIINFTELFRNIKHMPGAADNATKLAFVVTDKNGKVSEPLYIVIDEVAKLEASIASVGGIGFGASEMDVVVAYNGGNFEDDIKVQYHNDRGTWSDAAYTVAPASRAMNNYNVHITGLPANDDAVQIRVILGQNTVIGTETIERSGIKMTISPNDVFATYAIATLISTDGNVPDNVVFTANGNQVNSERIAGTDNFKITGLTPGSEISLAAKANGITSNAKIITEAATELVNGNMEQWSKDASGSHWELMTPTGWGTNNPMTTGQGSDYAYCRISGTTNTEVNKTIKVTTKVFGGNTNKLSDEQCAPRSGNNAAIIQTVGWGSNNSAAGNKGTDGACKYIDAGLMHLGSSRSERASDLIATTDLDCGIEMASRPKSLTFWYKYFPRNASDKGYAEIWVKDAAGNVIASTSANLDAAGDYAPMTLPLTYPMGAPKGAKIYVKFLSTYSAEFLERTNDNLVGPKFGNLCRGTFMGSQLVVDDIDFNY